MLNLAALRKLVENSGLPYKKNSVSWIFTCPRCKKPGKLYLSQTYGNFICWVCAEVDGFRGRPEFALSELLNRPIGVLRTLLYGEKDHQAKVYFDFRLKDFFGDGDALDDDAEEILTQEWPTNFIPIDHQKAVRGANYLASRGIPLEVAKEYDIMYSNHERRVGFPIKVDGRLVGYQARIIIPTPRVYNEDSGRYDQTQKIMSSKGIPRERLVMFLDRLKGSKHVVLCEGPVDALKAHLCGGNVATMGKAISAGQIALLRSLGLKKVYLALDPDAAAETQRLVRLFSDLEVYLMRPSEGVEDLGAMSMEDVREVFQAAPRVNPGTLFTFFDRDAHVL